MFRRNFPHVDLVWLFVLLSGLLLSVGCSTRQVITPDRPRTASSSAVNINSASTTELEKLPSVGPSLAQKIVEHRTLYGPFRKPEHLLVIEGVSDRRFQEIKHLVTVD